MANDSNAVEPGITRELARARAEQISDLRYRLSVTLEPGASRMKGRVEIRCQVMKAGDQLVLDFRDLDANGRVIDGVVSDLSINGESVAEVRQSNGHILLPGASFRQGENLIALSFETGIASAGRPITRFMDRDDGSEYIYTLFVPMDASLAFPCFDQPDLKGKLTLDVTVPQAWLVSGNGALEKRVPATRPDYATHHFRETPPISTYLFSFAAGPFQRMGSTRGPVSIELYFRKSKKEVAPDLSEVLELTNRGMRHLAEFFGQPFPFAKYDQVLLPGFAYGGMEHAGATFLREDAILFRTTPTVADKLNRASLILHELTHQWFGDLVTMRWFDDLWLKEGFANYMASHAMDAYYAGPNRIDIWKRFYQVHKPAAYAIDSTQGTTPIYQEVRNLADAKSAYGAIVYQKAPSLLRALSFTIGESNFRDGVRLFLKEHAYGNAEWADLIKAFERASGLDLEGWAAAWIKQRGMPQVDVEWKCDGNGRLSGLLLRQRNVLGDGHEWPIRTQVLLAYHDAPAERITVDLKSETTTVLEAEGRKCPAYIFANDGDYAYGRFLLDKQSRAGAIAQLSDRTDPFLRTMLWGALWDAVRESEMAPNEYLALAIRLLRTEADEELVQSLLTRATIVFQRYLSVTDRREVAPALEELCLDRMQKAGDLGRRINFYRAFRSLASTEAGRQKLKELLAGNLPVQGLEFKPLDRWQTLRTLVGLGDPDAEKLLAEEKVRDASDEGRKQAYLTEAARRNSSAKQRYFADYLENRSVPEDWIEGSLASFNFWDQSELTRPYLKRALEALPQVKRERKIFFGLAWLNGFIGGQRSPEALQTVREFLKHGELDPDLRLKVLEVTDELERTVRIREPRK
ncbi:MAG: M1 family aminopeptidase [Acidobacteriota bacterium]